MLLDAIDQIEVFVQVFVLVYALTIVLYVLASWLRLPYSLNPVQRFLHDVCDPYLRIWRRILPVRFGPVDLSPMVAIFALWVLGRLVTFGLSKLH